MRNAILLLPGLIGPAVCLVGCDALDVRDAAVHLRVSDTQTGEPLSEVQVEFVTTGDLGDRTPDEHLDECTDFVGTTDENGLLVVPVVSTFPLVLLPYAGFGFASAPVLEFVDEFWIVRLDSDDGRETFVLTTDNYLDPQLPPSLYDFSVRAPEVGELFTVAAPGIGGPLPPPGSYQRCSARK